MYFSLITLATLRDEQINLNLLGFGEEELTRLLADQEERPRIVTTFVR